MRERNKDFGQGLTLLAGFGLGAGLMYMLDPDRGARRRSMARDQASRALRAQRTMVDKGVRDLGNRVRSVPSRLRAAVFEDRISDDILVERIRAQMGRWISHPSSIEVTARDGRVTLSGPILDDEVEDLVNRVWRMRGVHTVEDRLEPHRATDDVPGLQGGSRPRPRPLLLRETWPPSVRLLAAGTSLATGVYGLRRGGLLGRFLAAASAAVLTRALVNQPARRMVGVLSGRRAIALHKTITIDAPVAVVFDFWNQFENIPLFMPHVREIRVSDDGKRSHWKVEGLGGSTIHWDVELTASEPGKVLAWKTLPGSTVEHSVNIRFEEAAADRARLDIRMSYNFPAGALGQLVARLFHKDPKTVMDEDMVRLKTLLEARGAPRSLEPAAPSLHS